MSKKKITPTKPQSFLVTDEAGMVLRIEREGKWLIASSPFDPELITQAKTIDEAFAMAYDVKNGLDALRAEAACFRKVENTPSAPRPRKAVAATAKRTSRPSKRIGART